ncbi:MAG: hypothetical protein EON58_13105 [Alphaproteobacteria bacterium]|nr:MAG: hypothetical protein EON58_13105 [Alphaproteobacteria bacterium]
MTTTQNAKSNQPPVEIKSSTEDTNNDAFKLPELFQQLIDQFKPLIEFNKETEKAKMHDVTIRWDVTAIRGKDTVFAKNSGSSTLPYMLAPIMMAEAPSKIDQEITDKIVKPFVATFQDFVNTVALEQLAASRAASGLDDQTNDDLP